MALQRSSDFLKCFWDLASDETALRVEAVNGILSHLSSTSGNDDRDYAVKRLVKGLASSRASARLGFSSALTCLLQRHKEVTVTDILKLSDETTRMSNGLKGMDDRELLFGKLFCILCIMRSGRLSDKGVDPIELLYRVLEIHQMRGWIREVTVEAMLLFMASTKSLPEVASKAAGKIAELLTDPVEDLAAWQIALLIGMKPYSAAHYNYSATACPLDILADPHQTLDQLSTTLLAATSGFPKLHRVWDYLLGEIFPLDAERALPTHRSKSLSASQEQLLLEFTAFLSSSLLGVSHEKRGVALRLSVLLLQRSPPEFFPQVLSKELVRLVMAARQNNKHTLHEFTLGILQEWREAVGESVSCRLALASVLVQFGNANLDAITGSSIVSSLLEGLGRDSIFAHIKFLCGIIAASAGQEAEDSEASAVSAVEALVLLARNSRLGHRSFVTPVVIGILVRISCFAGPAPAASKSAKKKKKDKAATSCVPGDCAEALIDCLALLEPGLLADSAPEALAEAAAYKLLSLLSDVGFSPLADAAESPKHFHLDVAVALAMQMRETLAPLRASGDEDDEDVPALLVAAGDCYHALQRCSQPGLRVFESLRLFLASALLHVITTEEIPLAVLADITAALPPLLALVEQSLANKDKTGARVTGDAEGSLEILFEASVEMLCSSDERPVKGVREAIKRVWHELCGHIAVERSLLDKAVARIVQSSLEKESEQAEGDGDEDEEDDDGAEEENEEPEEDAVKAMEVEEVEEEDDEAGDMLQHDASADAALAEMIGLRKQSRKQGMLEAKRRELLLDTRCIDLVEIMLRHTESADIVLPQLLPILSAVKAVVSSSSMLATQEGAAFESKVRGLLDARVCKAKLRFQSDLAASPELCAVISDLLEQLQTSCRSSLGPLRSLGASCLTAVIRALLATGHQPLIDQAGAAVQALLTAYLAKKNSRVSVKIFDDVQLRFADFSVTYMLEPLTGALTDAKTPFLQAEAFRLFGTLLKKVKAVGKPVLALVRGSLPRGASAIASVAGDKDVKAKLLSAVLACCKDIISAMHAPDVGVHSVVVDELKVAMKTIAGTQAKDGLKKSAEAIAKSLDALLAKGNSFSAAVDNKQDNGKRKAAAISDDAKKQDKHAKEPQQPQSSKKNKVVK